MSPASASSRLRALVLGSGAGGGVPQWNCGCRVCRLAWSGDSRVKPRTQSSLAVSVDGANWLLLNASIDLRQQILATPALQPKGGASFADRRSVADQHRRRSRGGPAELTRAPAVHDLGHAGHSRHDRREPHLRRRRPRHRPAPHCEARRAVRAAARVDKLELFPVPGKVPLWLEEERSRPTKSAKARSGSPSRRRAANSSMRRLRPRDGGSQEAFANAHVLFFDGTLFADDEMIINGLGDKTGRRMGHMPVSGTGRNARGTRRPRACAAHPHPHQQHRTRFSSRDRPKRQR